MEAPTLMKKLFDELKNVSILDRVSFVANFFGLGGFLLYSPRQKSMSISCG